MCHFIACLSFMVARTPEHQCLLLSLFLFAHAEMQRHIRGSKLQCYETLQVAFLSMGIHMPFYATVGENIRLT